MRTGLARKNLIAFRAKGESLIHPLTWVVPTSPSADKDVRDPHARPPQRGCRAGSPGLCVRSGLPDLAALGPDHGIAGLALIRLGERRHVRKWPVHSEARQRVRVGSVS